MASYLPIVYDTTAIGQKLREIEEERALALRRAVNQLRLPTGWRILLSSEVAPPLKLHDDVSVAFVLHMARRTPLISVAYMRPPSRDPSIAIRDALKELINWLKEDYTSVNMYSAEYIALTAEDCQRLADQIRASR